MAGLALDELSGPFPPKPFHDFLIPWSQLNSAGFAIITQIFSYKTTSVMILLENDTFQNKAGRNSYSPGNRKIIILLFAWIHNNYDPVIKSEIFIQCCSCRHFPRRNLEKDGSSSDIFYSLIEKIVVQRHLNVAFYLKQSCLSSTGLWVHQSPSHLWMDLLKSFCKCSVLNCSCHFHWGFGFLWSTEKSHQLIQLSQQTQNPDYFRELPGFKCSTLAALEQPLSSPCFAPFNQIFFLDV